MQLKLECESSNRYINHLLETRMYKSDICNRKESEKVYMLPTARDYQLLQLKKEKATHTHYVKPQT